MPRISFRALNQIGKINDRALRSCHKSVRRAAEIGDRGKVLLWIAAIRPLEQLINENDARSDEELIAIGIGIGDIGNTNVAVSASVIFDDDRLTELLR